MPLASYDPCVRKHLLHFAVLGALLIAGCSRTTTPGVIQGPAVSDRPAANMQAAQSTPRPQPMVRPQPMAVAQPTPRPQPTFNSTPVSPPVAWHRREKPMQEKVQKVVAASPVDPVDDPACATTGCPAPAIVVPTGEEALPALAAASGDTTTAKPAVTKQIPAHLETATFAVG